MRQVVAKWLDKVATKLSVLAFRVYPVWEPAEWERQLADEDEAHNLETCPCGQSHFYWGGFRYGSLGGQHPSAYQSYCSARCALRYKRSERSDAA